MTQISDIRLQVSGGEGAKITQLYRHLELFSEGDPPRHSLFIFSPAAGPLPMGDVPDQEQLLVIDPPHDLSSRFRLPAQTAVLYTGPAEPVGVPAVQTMPGGVAHLRIGDHFLDVYSQQASAIIHLPALGVILSGDVGSDQTVPRLAPGSEGDPELETLRLVARLLKNHRLSLLIPRIGMRAEDKLAVMERMAADVEYLHVLRRVVVPLARQGEPVETILRVAESILPAARRTAAGWAGHRANITSLIQTAGQTTSP
jgi:hypothetical protein